MHKLIDLPGGSLVHPDGWKYVYFSDGENVICEYYEFNMDGVEEKRSEFSVPVHFAVQLFEKLSSVAIRTDKV